MNTNIIVDGYVLLYFRSCYSLPKMIGSVVYGQVILAYDYFFQR